MNPPIARRPPTRQPVRPLPADHTRCPQGLPEPPGLLPRSTEIAPRSTLAGPPPTGLTTPRRPRPPPPGPPPGPGAAPVQVKRLSVCAAGNRRIRGPSEPVLPCTRNDHFLQKVRSRLRKTSKNDNVQASALTGRAPRKPSRGQPGTNASRTAKKILPPVQVKRLSSLCSWKMEGSRALRTGAPAHAKRLLSSKGTLSST